MNWEKVGGTPPIKMSEVDDNKVVIVKIFKTLDLAVDFAIWRAFAGVLAGAIYCQRAVKNSKPEIRSSLETGGTSRWCNVGG
jgi:hypothetical protein